MIRLTKRLALTGRYSRHEADKLVSQGRVAINGVVALSGAKVSEDGGEVITVDGKALAQTVNGIYKFHKPRGVLSSYGDPNGKRDLSDFCELAKMKLGYSGRLDYDSEGLMLFTNDGALIYTLQRSEFHVEKEYMVDVNRDISADWLIKLRKGVQSGEDSFLPCIVEQLASCKYRVILVEGKKRQVRRMFKEAGATVMRLVRIRIGTVQLGNLKHGALIELTEDEVEELKACIELQ